MQIGELGKERVNHQKVIKKTSRSHQEAAVTPSRRPKTSSRSDKTCQIVTKFLNIFRALLGLPESIKNRQEVPRSCQESLFEKSRRSIKTPSSAHFLFKFVQWDRGLTAGSAAIFRDRPAFAGRRNLFLIQRFSNGRISDLRNMTCTHFRCPIYATSGRRRTPGQDDGRSPPETDY